jgi:hypothetical protein
VLINCPLCKQVSEVPGLVDREGKMLDNVQVMCPECGYNTNIKAQLERIRKYHKDARMFDPLDFPETTPAQEIIDKRIEWARFDIESDVPNKSAREFEISLLENVPLDLDELKKKIRELKEAMRSARDPIDLDRMNFERQILCWTWAVMERQQQK